MTLFEAIDLTPDPAGSHPGHSYFPTLQARDQAWNDIRYGEYGDLRMIRTPEWKLVYRYPAGPHDLFDLVNDPSETINLIDDDDKQALIAELKDRLDAFYIRHEDPEKNGLQVKALHRHSRQAEAWWDGLREGRR